MEKYSSLCNTEPGNAAVQGSMYLLYTVLYVQQCIGEEGGEREDRSRSRRKEEDRDKNTGRRKRRNGLDTKKAAEKGEGG